MNYRPYQSPSTISTMLASGRDLQTSSATQQGKLRISLCIFFPLAKKCKRSYATSYINLVQCSRQASPKALFPIGWECVINEIGIE